MRLQKRDQPARRKYCPHLARERRRLAHDAAGGHRDPPRGEIELDLVVLGDAGQIALDDWQPVVDAVAKELAPEGNGHDRPRTEQTQDVHRLFARGIVAEVPSGHDHVALREARGKTGRNLLEGMLRHVGIVAKSPHACESGQRRLKWGPMHPTLERFLQQFKATSDAIIDSWFVCDAERNIVDYNRAFYALFPRQEARTLKGRLRREREASRAAARVRRGPRTRQRARRPASQRRLRGPEDHREERGRVDLTRGGACSSTPRTVWSSGRSPCASRASRTSGRGIGAPAEMKMSDACFSDINWNSLSRIIPGSLAGRPLCAVGPPAGGRPKCFKSDAKSVRRVGPQRASAGARLERDSAPLVLSRRAAVR